MDNSHCSGFLDKIVPQTCQKLKERKNLIILLKDLKSQGFHDV